MTVEELIETLKKLPAKKKVVFIRGDLGYCERTEPKEITVRPIKSDPECFWEEFYPDHPDLIDPNDPPLIGVVAL